MSKLETLLSQYAAYHLDHKNVLTHICRYSADCLFNYVFNGACRYHSCKF